MERIAKQLKGQTFDWYVAITRGGLVPACLLAQMTDQKRIDTFCVGGYDAKKRRSQYSIVPKNYDHLKDCDILVIDDLVDTGVTMVLACSILGMHARSIKTAVVYKKDGSTFQPDYFVEERPADEWIMFPWEEDRVVTSKVKGTP